MEMNHSVREHYNARPNTSVADRQFSQIINLRSFNNWVKAVQINLHASNPQISVLDLACGKGGDLNKWNRSKICKYVGIDIAPISIEHAKQRASEIKPHFEYSFHSADTFSQSVEHIILDQTFDLVSCQFALHYAFKSASILDQAFRNVSLSLKPGGYFFGIIADGSSIRKAKALKNSIFSIDFSNQKSPGEGDVFGIEYTFNLIDAIDSCPEYLSNQFILESVAESHNLNLLYYMNLEKFYLKYANQFEFLLKKMKVCSDNGHLLLSPDEAEVADLYSAFCFQKIK
jgi:mRNA (guanine-N7-)-methyltransferase